MKIWEFFLILLNDILNNWVKWVDYYYGIFGIINEKVSILWELIKKNYNMT